MSDVIAYAPLLLQGLLVTLLVTVLSAVVAVVTAFTAGLARLSQHWWLRWPAGVFVEVFRGTSLLVQMFWFFFALPFFGFQLAPLTAAVLALGLNEGSYAAEIVRGTISSRAAGQTEACVALGMGRALRMRRVLIPQSIPAMLPPFCNVLVDLLKNTSLVSLVTVADLTFTGQMVRNTTGQTTAVFLTILVFYFVLSSLISLLMKWLERRFALDRRPRSSLPGPLVKAGVPG
ncbi:ectoine/hydroxyectoine ABC transporter permease subunit EhuC [Nonomuraea sp. K274]|uniref:Ectoine/hydroxyectoine ABC transporter permease subunit EhuC n=1 Tax=Nonomuraea cypriaca TaxID=1187855 RepID=A0A931EUP2_9ACTN|nr:ectoine/hydroxyectoine ABC transporter permease subunit EhuC [Nonomuraea cypriaca]MBF8184759.1 ectoine/hydroxyectoine ABC transporter permease subunit EhuC [Nonomuraea cypriaca]